MEGKAETSHCAVWFSYKDTSTQYTWGTYQSVDLCQVWREYFNSGENSWSLTLVNHGWLPSVNWNHGQPPWSTMSISDHGQTLQLTLVRHGPWWTWSATIYCPSVTMVSRVQLWSNIVTDHGQTRLTRVKQGMTMVPFLKTQWLIVGYRYKGI